MRGFGHAETDRDHIQKSRHAILDRVLIQVVAYVETQFVGASGEILFRQDRRVGAPVVIG